MTKYERYINNIQSKKVNHGKWISQLVAWHLNQVKNGGKFEFKPEIADKYIAFIECLEFTQGKWAGRPFLLEDWQAFFIAMMFGWVNRESGLRRFKQVTLNVPKKNGKTELGAAIALACSYLDKDERGQIFMAATTQDQAAICFEAAKSIVKRIPGLAARYTQRQHRLIVKKNETYIRYISSEADATEGKGASVVIFDEEHLQVTNELRDNLKSGMGAREQPLFISISTAGTDKNGVYHQHLKTCKKILDGLIEDDSHLILIYAAPEKKGKVDWRNPEVWKIANPNWGVSVLEENFIVDFTEAVNEPHKQPNFITKKLNIWADSSATWIDSKKWEALGKDLKLSDYYGQECFIGIDGAVNGDFSALCIAVPDENREKVRLFFKYYIPEEMADKRSRADSLNFKQWEREGLIKLTEGDATDLNVIIRDLVDICGNFNYKPIAYDSAYLTFFATTAYNDYSLSLEAFSQSVFKQTIPTNQFYEWVMKGQIEHDNNPITAWMLSNVEMRKPDDNGNTKISKGKSKNKIDGIAAAINAIGRMLQYWEENPVVKSYAFHVE